MHYTTISTLQGPSGQPNIVHLYTGAVMRDLTVEQYWYDLNGMDQQSPDWKRNLPNDALWDTLQDLMENDQEKDRPHNSMLTATLAYLHKMLCT